MPAAATPRPLHLCAVQVSATDNVAVAKTALQAGERIVLPNGEHICLTGDVPPGHRFALRAIPAEAWVLQYGQPIGRSLGIAAGDAISHTNMRDETVVVREVPAGMHNPPTELLPAAQRRSFRGFARSNGRVGTRNFVLIVPTSMCASHEAQQIATLAEFTLWNRERFPNVDGVTALPHNKGCGCSDGSNLEVMLRTLANYADHPNVGAVLFMDLGCEKTNLSLLDKYLKSHGGMSSQKPVEWLGIQDVGGTQAAIEQGLAAVGRMLAQANQTQRSAVSVEHLSLGVKCGGSDGFSGLSANPALGHCADLLVKNGGTVLITEVPEFCGGEHLFAARAKDHNTAQEVFAYVDWYKQYAAKFGTKLDHNPSPGNIAGGLLNITIKSLGAMAKAGTTRVEGCTPYAQPPMSRGLHLMQGPGYDQESTPGLVGAGAQVVVFTTGRGTTIGNAIAPVLKLASNTPIFERMVRDLDANAGTIIDGNETIEQVGERLFAQVIACASGDVPAKAELHKHREFQLWAEQSVSL